MWLTDLLRKLTKGPDVGETFRDYIGCYVYGTEVSGSGQPQYVGAPTTVAQLETEVRAYLQDFLNTQQQLDSPDARTVQALLAALPQRLGAHLGGDMQQPFIVLGGVEMFVRKGVRQRHKEHGKFVE